MKSQKSVQLNTIDKEIEELIKEFEQTQIKQNKILSSLKNKVKVREEIEDTPILQSGISLSQGDKIEENRIVLTVKELPYSESFQPQIGDEVRIVNPKPGQASRGKIQGFCKDRKARVKVENSARPIGRAWKNIVCVHRPVTKKDGGQGSYKRRLYVK